MMKKPKPAKATTRKPTDFELHEVRAAQIAARLGIDREELLRQAKEQIRALRKRKMN